VLTPPGTGAIATVAVAGPRAWEIARQLFRPAKGQLPDVPELHRFWFGTLAGGDEVILAVKQVEPETQIEVHCHGGRRVVRWVVEQFTANGCTEGEPGDVRQRVLSLLARAPTLRTASILLDQHHGAFDRAGREVLTHLESDQPEKAAEPLAELARFASVGRHLVEPWKVVVAGPPNVGKSSLVNALAGYQRSVVSEVAGTTRDVVTVPVAFDGWPVELADTAGLRDAAGLEAAGIDRAKRFLAEADLVIWLLDGSDPKPVWPTEDDFPRQKLMSVVTKSDLPLAWDLNDFGDGWGLQCVSAVTGEGVPGFTVAIARRLVPEAPTGGAAVPFTPHLADLVEAAHAALADGRLADAARLLRDAIGSI
jgi:tRNA modification GTPase